MKLYVIRDSNFTLASGVPSSNLLHYEAYASRYLQVFSQVCLVGRLLPKEDATSMPVTGPNVSFHAFPHYQGPVGFLKNIWSIVKSVSGTIDPNAAYILRIPATIPSIYALVLWARGIPFAVEVAADPYDGYSEQALNGARLAAFWRWLFVAAVRWQCKTASATAYVTSSALQRRYPPANAETTFSFTSLDLTNDCYREPGAIGTAKDLAQKDFHLVMVGNMQKSLKGHDTLLYSMAKLVADGVHVRATIIGFGESRGTFETLADTLGLRDRVVFTGKLPGGKAVRDELARGDLFVLPSRQEGLPRALLEAMAMGLPAIASDVGGTSELLPNHALIQPDDVEDLVRKIKRFVLDDEYRRENAIANLMVARNYHIDVVNGSRVSFFNAVKEASGLSAARNK